MSQDEALGVRRDEVVVVPYDARWPRLFAEAANEIHRSVGSAVLAIHHVGSTSVPGLCAKPLLDILVSVANVEAALLLVPVLEELGYELRPNEAVSDRRFFRRPPGGALRTHHLSLAEPASRHHSETLAFRDALRADPRIANDCAQLKLRLATEFSSDRRAYIEAKTAFVTRIVAARLR